MCWRRQKFSVELDWVTANPERSSMSVRRTEEHPLTDFTSGSIVNSFLEQLVVS